MVATLDEFVQSLTESGLMTADEVREFLRSLPPQRIPLSAVELATEMFRQKKLTKYQAQAIYQRKTRALVMGNYVVQERLGAGGMGQVFKARHRKMDRIVALKVLPLETTKSPQAVLRFHREVKAAARLSHQNIVTAFDADEADGVHFLVMEYVEGENLSARVRASGPLSVDQAVSCILQAARGLEFAHSEGVTHRDIKPSNLLLDKRGTVKILDMGLARIEESVDPDRPPEEITHGGYVMGSVDYMSPEQGYDLRATDYRSDVYSLGATLHFLLTGRPMYQGASLVQRILAHRDQPTPSLRAARADVPEALDAIFHRMVAKRPEDRFPSMREVVAALESCFGRVRSANGNMPIDETVAFRQDRTEDAPAAPKQSLFEELLLEDSISVDVPAVTPFSFSLYRRRRRRIMFALAAVGVALVTAVLFQLLARPGAFGSGARGEAVIEVNELGAVVEISDEQGNTTIVQKNNWGTVVQTLQPGRYTLRVEKQGFRTYRGNFSVRNGASVRIQVTMEPDA